MTTTRYDARLRRCGAGVVAVALLLLAGCATSTSSDARPHLHRHRAHPAAHHSRSPSPAQPVQGSAARARADLDRLVVRPRPRGTEGYVRDAFGSDWERLALLAESARLLLTTEAPESVVRAIADRVMSFLGCDVFFNYVVEDAESMRLNAYAGVPAEEADRIARIEFGQAT